MNLGPLKLAKIYVDWLIEPERNSDVFFFLMERGSSDPLKLYIFNLTHWPIYNTFLENNPSSSSTIVKS